MNPIHLGDFCNSWLLHLFKVIIYILKPIFLLYFCFHDCDYLMSIICILFTGIFFEKWGENYISLLLYKDWWFIFFRYPLYFTFDKNVINISSIQVHKDDPVYSVNIKRSILSSLQLEILGPNEKHKSHEQVLLLF